MEVSRVRALRGPNLWSRHTAIEAVVSCSDEECRIDSIDGFEARLRERFPEIGVLQLMGHTGAVSMAHVLEVASLALQAQSGCPVTFSRTAVTQDSNVFQVVIEYTEEEVGRRALELAEQLCQAAVENKPFDLAAAIAELKDLDEDVRLGPSTGAIVDAAVARGIPYRRLTQGSLVQFGWGSRQRRIQAAETDRSSAIAEGISRNKDLTKQLLTSCGVPVPEGRIVDSPEDAWDAAEDIGVPVVVKPTDANHARGVSTELMTRAEVEAAYHLAEAEGSEVLVERFIRGNEHRLLVVGGKLAAAVRGETVSVLGDGVATIRELIDRQINSDPRRGEEEEFPLDMLLVDKNPAVKFEIERQGYTAESILPKDVSIIVQRSGNVAFDVTDIVHPEVAATVSLAARVVGLDIAGIDLVAEDISRPLDAQGGAIVEVNAGPGLLMHLKPAEGQPRPVGKAIVDHLFADDETGRIPVVGIAGSSGKTQVARILAKFIHLTGSHVGLACSDGLFSGKRQVEKGNCATWTAAQKLLMNRKVETAVIENSVSTILAEGLGYDRCQVGIVTNIQPEKHFGEFYIETPEQVYNVLRTQVDVVLANGAAVLNAEDPLVAQMAELCDGEVVFFATNSELPVIRKHLKQGGRAVLKKGDGLILATSLYKILLTNPAARPISPQNIQPLLAAVAAAWALGISPDLISAGVKTFSLEQADA